MKTIFFIICFGLLSTLLASDAAIVKKLKGSAHIIRNSKELTIKIGTKIFEKDIIVTGSKSLVGLIFKDNTRVSVGSKSRFEIEKYIFEPSKNKEAFVTNLSKGSTEFVTGLISKINPQAFKIKVKTATIGIRGTHFIVNVD